MARWEIEHVEVDEECRAIGIPDPGTRNYKAYATDDQAFYVWLNEVLEICERKGVLSPVMACMLTGTTKGALFHRLRKGSMTAFHYHKVTRDKDKAGQVHIGMPMTLIPVSELMQWVELTRRRKNQNPPQRSIYETFFLKSVPPEASLAWQRLSVVWKPKKQEGNGSIGEEQDKRAR